MIVNIVLSVLELERINRSIQTERGNAVEIFVGRKVNEMKVEPLVSDWNRGDERDENPVIVEGGTSIRSDGEADAQKAVNDFIWITESCVFCTVSFRIAENTALAESLTAATLQENEFRPYAGIEFTERSPIRGCPIEVIRQSIQVYAKIAGSATNDLEGRQDYKEEDSFCHKEYTFAPEVTFWHLRNKSRISRRKGIRSILGRVFG